MLQSLLAEVVGLVEIGATRMEKFHHRQIAFPSTDHQAAADHCPLEIGRHPAVQPIPGRAKVALLDHD